MQNSNSKNNDTNTSDLMPAYLEYSSYKIFNVHQLILTETLTLID